MDLKTLKDIPPWEWPEGTGEILLEILRDDQAGEEDRLIAAELAGDLTVINDEVAEALLAIVGQSGESEEMRGTAAISLGPALEQAYLDDFEMDDFEDLDETPISELTFGRTRETLRKLYVDSRIPEEVRRRILETSVRAPQDWHRNAVRAAYYSWDEAWKLTAVFCMRFINGFADQILEALGSRNLDIHYEAVCAAGNWEMDEAWPHIAALVTSGETEKDLLLAAIDAAAFIRPQKAAEILGGLLDSDDEEIVEAAHEAMAMAGELRDDGEDEDEDDGFLH